MSQIIDFTETKPVNEYAADVQALIEAGPGKALQITAPLGQTRDGKEGNGDRARLKFQSAANDAGYTARVRAEDRPGDGTVTFTFTLTTKHKRNGEAKAEREASEAATPEVVEESPEENIEASPAKSSRR